MLHIKIKAKKNTGKIKNNSPKAEGNWKTKVKKEETKDMLDLDSGRSERALTPSSCSRFDSVGSLAKPLQANFLC